MAIPPRLHVGVIFMIQFMLLIMLLGITVPALHTQGLPWIVLVPATVAGLALLLYLISLLGKLVSVRCTQCRAPSRYQGLGWWPFIYRYTCTSCGHKMRYEISA